MTDHTAALLEAIARHFPDDPANAARAHAALTDALVHPQPSRTLTQAVVSCPHEITAEEVILRYDPKQPGKNAFDQLMMRIEGAQPQQPAGWRDIETAPKDGSRVLIWHSGYLAPTTAQWYGAEGWKLDGSVAAFWNQPTHWMPLPAPPGAHPSQQEDDARDAARYRKLRRKVCIVGSEFQIINLAPTYVAPDAAAELDAVLDSAGEGGKNG